MNKELWLKNYITPWGNVRMWILRDYSKAFPIQVYFWDIPDCIWREDNE